MLTTLSKLFRVSGFNVRAHGHELFISPGGAAKAKLQALGFVQETIQAGDTQVMHKGDVIINIDLDETVAAFGNGGRDIPTLVIEDVSYYHKHIAKTIADYGIPFNGYFSAINGGLYYSIHAIDFEFVKSLFPTLKIPHDTHENEVGYLSWTYNGREHCLYLSEVKLTKSKKKGL